MMIIKINHLKNQKIRRISNKKVIYLKVLTLGYVFLDEKNHLKEDNNSFQKINDPKLIKNEALKFMGIVMFSPEKVKLINFKKQNTDLRLIKRVILHYHGGGFICMSSKSHQRYLRYFLIKECIVMN